MNEIERKKGNTNKFNTNNYISFVFFGTNETETLRDSVDLTVFPFNCPFILLSSEHVKASK
jgi:hypothetical protein